jgi:ADP-ribosylglycohydrolase
MKTTLIMIVFWAVAASVAFAARGPVVTINEADFRDKVHACWLGKNIGGTLGMPFEGQQVAQSLTFFKPVPEKPAANDDLDLQLLWLKALEERGTNINARTLGEYWLKYVPVDWNEYGIGKANMRDGFLPPVSGQFRNAKWRNSNGAWIRSEIWACLAPGCPSIAAKYAYEDACVDHGAGEGTFAEMFTAAVESAAFVESDRDRLLEIGLSYIPAKCAVAVSIRATMDAHKRGLDWTTAREVVIKSSESTGWFQAPRNVAFTILGWLYGNDDFGKTICTAVNCGDDTDCTGATVGSILGIIHGGSCISATWRRPVGEGISNVAISGFKAPGTLTELTDATPAMARKVLADNNAPVAIVADKPTDLSRKAELSLEPDKAVKALWTRSPYKLAYESESCEPPLTTYQTRRSRQRNPGK